MINEGSAIHIDRSRTCTDCMGNESIEKRVNGCGCGCG